MLSVDELHTWPNQVCLLNSPGHIPWLDASESVAMLLLFSVRPGQSSVSSLYLEVSVKPNSRNKGKKYSAASFTQIVVGFYGIIKISKMVFV